MNVPLSQSPFLPIRAAYRCTLHNLTGAQGGQDPTATRSERAARANPLLHPVHSCHDNRALVDSEPHHLGVTHGIMAW